MLSNQKTKMRLLDETKIEFLSSHKGSKQNQGFPWCCPWSPLSFWLYVPVDILAWPTSRGCLDHEW